MCARSVSACPTRSRYPCSAAPHPRSRCISSHSDPPTSKLTRSKQRWAREGRFLTGKTSGPEQQRLPPGQHLTRDWPTLDLGLTPEISRERWRLDVYGAVETPIFWN